MTGNQSTAKNIANQNLRKKKLRINFFFTVFTLNMIYDMSITSNVTTNARGAIAGSKFNSLSIFR